MVGTILKNRYELTLELYEHPLFVCYAAKDHVVGSNVGIRIIRQEFANEPAFIEKLNEIILKYKKYSHPLLEKYLEFDDDQAPFIVTEYSGGQVLSDRVRILAPLSPHLAVAVSHSIAEALKVLHAANVAHGDIAPYNVMCSKEGRVRLMLPGIWETYSTHYMAGELVLPLMAPYIAPEVHKEVLPNPTSDVYSVGIVLHEMLIGCTPYSDDSPEGMAEKHGVAPVPAMRVRNPAIPSAVDDIVKKCLAKLPEERYQNATELAEDLKIMLDSLKFGRAPVLRHAARAEGLQRTSGPAMFQTNDIPRVAPKMGAIRDFKKNNRSREGQNGSRGEVLQKTLVGLIYSGGVFLIIMIGAWIYFNLSKPKLVAVPNLVRLSLNEANLRLQEMHLGLKINKREASEQFPEGTIMDINPSPGREVRENSYVYVTVSSGSRTVEVPDLKGLSVTEAKAMLSTLSLSLQETPAVVRSEVVPEGKIAGQIPEPNNKVDKFSKVKIFVSGGLKVAPTNQIPVITGGEKHTYNLQIKMPIVGSQVMLRVDIVDQQGTRTVYEKSQKSADVVNITAEGYGREVLFRVFVDGELVDQIQKKIAASKVQNNATMPNAVTPSPTR